jgi:hypothetical protein
MTEYCDVCGEELDDGICPECDESERLSVWDAADIYLSKGCDKDYMFGYTHDELMKASGN